MKSIVAIRFVFFFVGLIIFGLGISLAIKVQYLGLHPWDVLNIAMSQRFGFTIGTWSVLVGLILLLFTLFADRKYVNMGTFLNVIIVGPTIDFFLWLDILPSATNTWMDYLILLAGILITGVGGGMYVAAGIGAGPRDGFMLSLSEKTGLSVSRARILVESVVLAIGYFLGGPVFVVSLFYTFLQSPVFQHSMKWFKAILLKMELPIAYEAPLQEKNLS